SARVWDSQSGKQIHLLQGRGAVHTVLFNADGLRLITASEASGPALWDAVSGAQIAMARRSGTVAVALSGDGQSFPSSQALSSAHVWSTRDGTEVVKLASQEWPSDQVALNPNGDRLLVTSSDNPATLWNAQSGTKLAVLRGHKSDLTCVTFGHGGKLAAT